MEEFIAEEMAERNATTVLINENLSTESFSRRMFQAALLFDKFYTPILCLFGTLGNSLSLAVFSTDTKYKNQSASLYLSALAISDTGFLLSLLAVWLDGVIPSVGIITSSDFACSLVMYLGQVTCFLSVYLTVAFTIERYVAVHCPFSKGRIFTRTKAKRCVCALTIIALLICSYAWVIAKVIEYPIIPSTTSTDDDGIPEHENDEVNLNISPQNSKSQNQNESDYDHDHVVMMMMMTMKMVQEDVGRHANWDQEIHDFDKDIWNLTEEWKTEDDGLLRNLNSTHTQTQSQTPAPMKDIHIDIGDPSHSRYICSVPEEFYSVSEIANYCDTVITLIIPFLLITFFNVQIATCVWRLKTQRQNIVATPSRSRSPCCACESDLRRCSSFVSGNEVCKMQGRVLYRPASRNNSNGLTHHQTILIENLNSTTAAGDGGSRFHSFLGRNKGGGNNGTSKSLLAVGRHLQEKQRCRNRSHYVSPEVHVTKTLLLVSSVFLVLNLPSHAIRCAQFIQSVTGTREGQEMLRAFQPWANILFNTNFAVNFLLYCLSGKSFRSSLYHLLRGSGGGGFQYRYQRRGKVMKERLNRSFQSQYSRRCSATATMTTATNTGGGFGRDSCATNLLRIELGDMNMSMAVDESVCCGSRGSRSPLKYTPENEIALDLGGCGEDGSDQIVEV